ncbi:MAG: hypothetical protein CM15mP29_3070 [Alphaproteobacteria bacterium]|nr:MAG: hypothetical protein CM15mP29_3070 [Alphaproteobacteria bacterium]
MRRVVITGLGAVTPLGGDLKSSWKNLISGKSGASSITKFDATGYPCTIACEVPLGEGLKANDGSFNANDWISPKDQKKVDTFILFGLPLLKWLLKIVVGHLRMTRIAIVRGRSRFWYWRIGQYRENRSPS